MKKDKTSKEKRFWLVFNSLVLSTCIIFAGVGLWFIICGLDSAGNTINEMTGSGFLALNFACLLSLIRDAIGKNIFNVINKSYANIKTSTISIKNRLPVYLPGTVMSKIGDDGVTIEETNAEPHRYRYKISTEHNSELVLEVEAKDKLPEVENIHMCEWYFGYLDEKVYIIKQNKK